MTDIKWVKQKDSSGCGVAVFAMLVGCTYDEALAEVRQNEPKATEVRLMRVRANPHWWSFGSRKYKRVAIPTPYHTDVKNNGLTTDHLDRCLYARGFSQQVRISFWGDDMTAFAPLHYCVVGMKADGSGVYHCVVMLEDGRVLDPIIKGEFKLSDWAYVHSIHGLYRA